MGGRLHESANCIRRTLTEIQYKVKTRHSHFTACIGVFLGNSIMMDTYTVTCSQIQLASAIMALGWGKMGSASSG